MGVAKKIANGSHRHLSLSANRSTEDENQSEKKPEASKRPTTISGVRKKAYVSPQPPEAVEEVAEERKIDPKRFLVVIHYHYPPVIFPQALKYEIGQLESFFRIKPNFRGEGTVIHSGRLLATMTYRFNLKLDNARGFRKALCDILDRYGVEIVDYKIGRT